MSKDSYVDDDVESAVSTECSENDHIVDEEYKTAFFEKLVEDVLKPYDEDEEVDPKEVFHKLMKRASRQYADNKLMGDDKLWQKLADKADRFMESHSEVTDDATAFRHAMRCNKEIVKGVINRSLEYDDDDDEDNDDDDEIDGDDNNTTMTGGSRLYGRSKMDVMPSNLAYDNYLKRI